MAERTATDDEKTNATKKDRHKCVILHLSLLAAVVSLFASPSLTNGFVWDDHHVLERGTLVHDISNIARFFVHDTMYNSDGGAMENSAGMDTYRPVTMATFALDSWLFGNRVFGYHATNLVLHLTCTVLVYILCLSLLKGPKHWTAFAAALFFGLHPWSSEAYVWINGRSDPLSCGLALGTVLLWVSYVRGYASKGGIERWWRMWAAALLFLAACLSKETAVLLPLLLVLSAFSRSMLHIVVHRREQEVNACLAWKESLRILLGLVPIGIALAVYLLMRSNALKGGLRLAEDPAHFFESSTNLGLFIWDALVSMVVPANVHLRFLYEDYYSTPILLKLLALFAAIVSGSFAALASLSGNKRISLAGLGASWAILFLAPACLVTTVPNYYGFGRYLYIPLVGISLLVALVMESALGAISGKRAMKMAFIGAVVAYFVYFGIQLVTAAVELEDDRTMAEAVLEKDPYRSHGYSALARWFRARGDVRKASMVAAAGMKALAKRPMSLYMLGRALLQAGMFEQVESLVSEGIHLHPEFGGFYCLKAALVGAANVEEARMLLEKGLSLDPGNRDCRDLLERL